MQHISQLLPDQPHELPRSARLSETYAPERLDRAKSAVGEIFTALQTAMPARFSTMYPTPAEIKTAASIWAIGLIEARLTPKQISYGLAKAITNTKYCPDLPDFIALCRPTPEDMGLPTLEAAYIEACYNANPGLLDRKWSHPAVFHAYQQVGPYELRTLPKKQSLPQFEVAYQRTVSAVLNGEELPEIPKALENLNDKPKPPGWKPTDEDRAKGLAVLDSLKSLFKPDLAG